MIPIVCHVSIIIIYLSIYHLPFINDTYHLSIIIYVLSIIYLSMYHVSFIY